MRTRRQSAVKSVSWRLIGVAMLAVITYVITRDFAQTTIITVAHHGTFIVIFYAHERFWDGVARRGKPFLKAFTYEILLGFLVLGVITWVVTGSWKQVTGISTTYLILRFFLFPVHDRRWDGFYERRMGRRQAY